MGNTIGRTKLVRNIAKKCGLSPEICDKVFEAYTEEFVNLLISGDKIVLKNFMTFEIIERGERTCKDFNTGKTVTYPAVKSVKCHVSKVVRDAINERSFE